MNSRLHARLCSVAERSWRVVPFAMGQKLFDAATTKNKKFFVVEDGDHNGPQPDEYYVALGEFLDWLPEVGGLKEPPVHPHGVGQLGPR